MRMLIAAAACLIAGAVGLHAQAVPAERDAVMQTMQAFFDTMAAADVEGARKVLQPQGRFHALRMRDGKPDVREFSNEEYFADLKASKQRCASGSGIPTCAFTV
jgi:hypothetical protein